MSDVSVCHCSGTLGISDEASAVSWHFFFVFSAWHRSAAVLKALGAMGTIGKGTKAPTSLSFFVLGNCLDLKRTIVEQSLDYPLASLT